MALPLIAVALSLLSPFAHAHVCSPLTDGTTIGEIRACMGAQPAPVTPPVVPPVVTPPVTSNEACEAYGDNLDKARAAFAFQCQGRPRADCDPISGGWMCSTDVIGSAGPTSSAPTTAPTPAPPTSSAGLRIEAESVPLSQGWFNRGTHLEWIGGTERYLLSQRTDAANLVYTFNVPSAGTYRFNMRAKVGTIFNAREPGNDFWLQLPGKPWVKVWFNRDGNWHQDAIGEVGTTKSRELLDVTLSAGPATVVLSGRSRGAMIDWLELVPRGFDVGSASGDLIIIHADAWPDRDDLQYLAGSRSVVDALGLDPLVVIGTYGEDPADPPHLSFIPGAVEFTRSLYPDALDAHNDRQNAAQTAATRIIATLDAGYQVRISEGGTSDHTARVLRLVEQQGPWLNLKRVSVYQHSAGATAFNEAKALPANLAYVKSRTTYVVVPNGNVGGNGSADFQEPESSSVCQAFMVRARASRYGAQWAQTFTTLGNEPARRCDMSDLVSLLAIVSDSTTRTYSDFAARYL